MPDDPVLWIAIIVVVALLILFALVKGRIVKLKAGNYGLEFERQQAAEPSNISVASDLHVSDSTVGDIAGVKVSSGDVEVAGGVEVGRKARIEQARTGDIVGVKKMGPTSGH